MKATFFTLSFYVLLCCPVVVIGQSPDRPSFKKDVSTICPDCEFKTLAFAEKNILVQLQSGTSAESIQKEFIDQYNIPILLIKEIAPRFGYYTIRAVYVSDEQKVFELLQANTRVISAQWDSPVEFRDSIPNDPQWAGQWDMERIGLPKVWEVSTGGQTANGDEIVVAILDSGFDINHEDLQGNIWENKLEVNGTPGVDDDNNGYIDDFHGWNFIQNTNELSVTSHGTSVSGIIGGKGNNGIGVAGVNWNVKIMFLPIDLVSEVVAAFNYVIEQRELYNNTNGEAGSFVVATNGSFGQDAKFCEEQPTWGPMYDLMGAVGVLSMAATANENWDVDEVGDIPTTCTSDFLIAVTNTDESDTRVSNAAFGPVSIDLAAPGRPTLTTTLDDRYTDGFGGTSAATPHVTGAVALLYSLPCKALADLALQDPPAAALLMRKALLESTTPLPSLEGKIVTEGRLDVYESMKFLHAYCIAKEEERELCSFKETYLKGFELLNIYPNPSTNVLNVDYSINDFTDFNIRVFNVLGQEMELQAPIASTPFATQTFSLDVSDWATGTYFISIVGKEKELTRKFLVQ